MTLTWYKLSKTKQEILGLELQEGFTRLLKTFLF